MSKITKLGYDDVLDEQTLQLLGEAPAVQDVAPQQTRKLRKRVMQRIDDNITPVVQAFQTVHHHDGAWVELTPKIKKKVLFTDPETGAESYLLKAEAGAEAPAHQHEHDEHCLVLEGELTFSDGIHLKAGDYHFAPAGSEHGIARTDVGILVYIQNVQPGTPAVF